MEELKEIKAKLGHIEKLLKGNGVIGIAEMARRSFEMCQQMRSSKNGLMDWAFRMIIMLALGFIAAKVGLSAK